MKAARAIGIVVSLAAWPTIAAAQLRPQREPFDWSGLAVVGGLLVIGVVAYLLAAGRRK